MTAGWVMGKKLKSLSHVSIMLYNLRSKRTNLEVRVKYYLSSHNQKMGETKFFQEVSRPPRIYEMWGPYLMISCRELMLGHEENEGRDELKNLRWSNLETVVSLISLMMKIIFLHGSNLLSHS